VRYVTSMVLDFDHSNEFDVNYCFECVNNMNLVTVFKLRNSWKCCVFIYR